MNEQSTPPVSHVSVQAPFGGVTFNFLSSSFLLVYLFFVPFVRNQTYSSLTIMGDKNSNRPRTLGDYSRPSHEGYRNAIELPEGAKVSPCDPTPSDSIDLNGATRNTTHLRLFCFSLRDRAINWLDRLPAGSISTWDDLTTHFIAQFFPPGRTAKLRKDILMFQKHQGESLCNAWTHFKDLLQKVTRHGLDLWLYVQIFYDHVDYTTQMDIDNVAGGDLENLKAEEA
ncbi:zinc finger, CCHC-type containing protein [Tanacetum coccineum]